MYEIFSTDEREPFMERCLAPEGDWPNLLAGVRLQAREAARSRRYGREAARSRRYARPGVRQFAAAQCRRTRLARRPGILVRLDGLGPDADGEAVAATVRTEMRDGSGDRWAEDSVEHVYRFGGDRLVT